jgi:hypothetical protein
VFDTGTRVRGKYIWRAELGGISRSDKIHPLSGRKGHVRVVTAGETGSLPEAKPANSCYLRQGYVLFVTVNLDTNYRTGTSSVDTKPYCDLLGKEFDFQHISLRDVLHEKAADQTYLHAKFVRDCLEEGVNVPTQLAISLLEIKINEGIREGKSWSLVEGFPESIEQLFEFKKRVSQYLRISRVLLISLGAKIQLRAVSELLLSGNAETFPR